MKPRKRTKIILAIVLVVAAVIAGIAIYVGSILNKVQRVTTSTPTKRIPREEETFEVDTSEPDTIEEEEVEELFDVDSISMMEDDDIRNILLIGQDAREGESRQRSDTMIICSINTYTDTVTLASLMRDMYVPIPGYSNNRINAAYAFGGMELLDEVIEQDFGIPIDGNIEVDFTGFVEAMEMLGGVDIELNPEEAWYLSNAGWEDQGEFANDGTWELQEGMNTLNPSQALAFSRIRLVGNSDWERTDRQRRVIMAAFNKVSTSSTAQQLAIADSILPYITTDMTGKELLSFVKTIAVAGITEIDSYRIPVDGTYSSENISGMSVLVPDLAKNSELLKEYIYGKDTEPEFRDDEDDKDSEEDESETVRAANKKTGSKTSAKKRATADSGTKTSGRSAGNTGSTGGGNSAYSAANTYTDTTYYNTAGNTYTDASQQAPERVEGPAPTDSGDGGQDVAVDQGTAGGTDAGASGEAPVGTDADATGADAGTASPDAGGDAGGADAPAPAPEAPAPEVPAPEVPAPVVEAPAVVEVPAVVEAPAPAEGGD